jgi:putative DNA primase/helicase
MTPDDAKQAASASSDRDGCSQPLPQSENVEARISEAQSSTPSAQMSQENLKAEISRLRRLPTLEYERQRSSEAKRLGIRVTELDKQVNRGNDTGDPSTSMLFERVEPYPDPVEGVLLLYSLVAVIERYIVCERHVTQAVALWIVFSWCIKAFKIAPIACITAPEKRCCKTQLLTLMSQFCPRALSTSNITAPALFRSIEKWKPTLFIDEADAFLKQNEEMRGVLNAGFEWNGCVIRTVGEDHEPTPFNVFCAKAISGIGHLPDTLKDRSILFELRRKQKDETRERLRHADMGEFAEIKRKLARWSEDNLEALRLARPELPDALNDRAQDRWEPLLAIADQVGEHWPQIARAAAMAISGIDEHAPSINEELLSDIRLVFESMSVSTISSVQLIDELCRDEEAPWATWHKGKPMTPRQLSMRLHEFGITPKQIRFGARTLKGYELAKFDDAFNRYLIIPPPEVP